MAAVLARTHGVSRVSRALRLNFHKLRRCLAPPALRASGPRRPATFIELAPLAVSGPSDGAFVVELCAGDHGRMTVRFSGDRPALLGLAEAFWRRNR
jgi:hypothetical protein